MAMLMMMMTRAGEEVGGSWQMDVRGSVESEGKGGCLNIDEARDA